MKLEEIKNCSFQNWYSSFQNYTIKSCILPLPPDFVKYILKDGIILPKSCKTELVSSVQDDDVSDDEAPYFPNFDQSIQSAIKNLGGKVFPKLNWSSPKDASWIAFNNSCCCTSVSDVYLLLKSSDFIIHDLTKMNFLCEDVISSIETPQILEHVFLILRKWTEIDTAGEFRCFVKNNILIGISQREHSLYFEHLSFQKDRILEDVMYFFESSIQFKFPSLNYVFDIFWKKPGKVFLIDFNPFHEVTDALLFHWDELHCWSVKEHATIVPDFRYIRDNRGVQPRTLSYHAMPRDIIDISTGEDSFKLVDLMKLKIDEQSQESSGDENDES